MSDEQQAPKLLPCPLFGHLPDKGEFTNGPYIAVSGAPSMPKFYAVVCPGCCSTAYDENKERVIKKWNTRADLAPVAQPPEPRHHKHCSSWTVTTSGEKKPCDCVCECGHSMFQHIRPGEHYWYEDCAQEGCACIKFNAASLQPPSSEAADVARKVVEQWVHESPYDFPPDRSESLARSANYGLNLQRLIASALTSAQQRGAELQPQPMSTAPKDGTQVQVFHQNTPDERLAVNAALYTLRKGMWVSPDGGYAYDPIAWMPSTAVRAAKQQ